MKVITLFLIFLFIAGFAFVQVAGEKKIYSATIDAYGVQG